MFQFTEENPLNGRIPDSKCYAYIVPTAGSVVKPFPNSQPTDPGPSCTRNLRGAQLNQLPTVQIIPFFSVNCYGVVPEELLEPFVVCLRAIAPKILLFQPTPQRGNGLEGHFGSLCHFVLSFSRHCPAGAVCDILCVFFFKAVPFPPFCTKHYFDIVKILFASLYSFVC